MVGVSGHLVGFDEVENGWNDCPIHIFKHQSGWWFPSFHRQSDSNLTHGRTRNLTGPPEIIGSLMLDVPKKLAKFQKMEIGHDVFSTWMCHTQSHTVIVSITQVCAGVKLHAWFCHKRGWPWLTNIGGWYLWSLDCDDGMTIPHIDHVTWPWTRRKPRKRWKLRYGGDRLKPSMSLGFFI